MKLVACILKGNHINGNYLEILKSYDLEEDLIIFCIKTIFRLLSVSLFIGKDRFLDVGSITLFIIASNHTEKENLLSLFWASIFKESVERCFEAIYTMICKMANFYWIHAQISHMLLTE